jgi:hypothetical protein
VAALDGRHPMEERYDGEVKRRAAVRQGSGGLVHRHGPHRSAVCRARAGATVTFEPGARTAWHTHPLGQTLIVTFGLGWARREGGPVEEITPGDAPEKQRRRPRGRRP